MNDGDPVINKVDLIKDKTVLLPVIARLQELDLFEEVIPLSALRNDGVELFRERVFSSLPANSMRCSSRSGSTIPAVLSIVQ